MDLAGLLIFAGIYALAVATPGPAVIAVISRSMISGTLATLPFILGITLGDIVWFLLAASGMTLIAEEYPAAFAVIRGAGILYLIYVAVSLFRATVRAAEPVPAQAGDSLRQIITGLIFTLGNPKTMAFFVAILPQIIPLGHITGRDMLVITLLSGGLLLAVMTSYALLADHLRRLVQSDHALRLINRTSASLIMGMAVVMSLA